MITFSDHEAMSRQRHDKRSITSAVNGALYTEGRPAGTLSIFRTYGMRDCRRYALARPVYVMTALNHESADRWIDINIIEGLSVDDYIIVPVRRFPSGQIIRAYKGSLQ